MPFFTISAVIFIIVFTIRNRKNIRKQANLDESFWEKELKANATRKQDISQLDYITIPLELLLPDISSNHADKIRALSEKKIVNLSGITNTDLKLKYGVANLELLGEYDSNFADLIYSLSAYATELIEAGYADAAVKILEYAISINADSGTIYTTLGELYKDKGQADKLIDLIEKADSLSIPSKPSVLAKLNDLLNA